MTCKSDTFISWRVVLLLAIGAACYVDATSWNESGLFPSEVNEECHKDRNEAVLELKSDERRLGFHAFINDSEFGAHTACFDWGYWRTATVSFPKECAISTNKFKVRIFDRSFSNLYEDIIVVKSTHVPKYYLYQLDCTGDRPNVTMRRNENPDVTEVSFPRTFTIGNQQFPSKTSFNGQPNTNRGVLGDKVKIEIEVRNKNLFGAKAGIESCKLDIRHERGTSITIFDKSCLKPKYEFLEFQSKYEQLESSAKFTLEFKAFALRNLKPFEINCHACLDCNRTVECPKHAEDDSLFFPTKEWNENGSLTLKAPSEEVGKWTMYSLVFDGPFLKIGRERRLSESRQLIEPEFKDSGSQFIVHYYKNGGKFGNNIAVNYDDFSLNVRNYYTSSSVSGNPISGPEFEPTLVIGNQTFNTVANFANMKRDLGYFGESVKMEIEIGDTNLQFGEKSHFESCKLDIYYMDGHVESIPILKNSALTPEGRLIEFQSEYTPARGSERAKYTMNFKAFALNNSKPFYFNCQACSNCDEPVASGDNNKHDPRLKVTAQCNENDSVTLEFPSPSEEVGKRTMYSAISDGLFEKICGETVVSESWHSIEPECKDSTSRFSVYYYEDESKFDNNISIHADDILRQYEYIFDCNGKKSQKVFPVPLENRSSDITANTANFLARFIIGNTTFDTVITFSNEQRNYGNLSESVRMEIKIEDANLFGEKSHFESCKLDIYYTDGHVESIPILENSALTPEGRLIEFQSEYTPSRRYEPAKYTMNFKAFALKNGKPFYFNCRACTNCDKPLMATAETSLEQQPITGTARVQTPPSIFFLFFVYYFSIINI